MARLSEVHRRYVRRETVVGVVINTLLSVAFALAVSRGAPVALATAAIDFGPQVFMVTFATTLAITLIARKRLGAGAIPALPREQGGPLRWAPRNPLLRAVLFGALAAAVLAPLSAGLLLASGLDAVPATAFVLFKALYGALLSFAVAPAIVRAALAGEVAASH